jgi:L-lactate transport
MNAIWDQGYYIWGQGLPVSAAIAAIPTIVLLYLLAVKRTPAWLAGLSGLAVTVIVALAGYHMPVSRALSSAAYGAAFGLFPISWIVFWAIVLYNVAVDRGKFAVIRDSIGSLTSDLRIQALLIAFAFGAFIEGAAGFGTPVAVAGAMMVGLGFSPYYAAALCLLANTAPVAFGSIGLPIITLAGVTGLPLLKLSGAVGRLCAPIALILPAYLILTLGGVAATLEIWPAVLVTGLTFAVVQFLVSNYVGVELTVILSSLASMGALVVLLKMWKPQAKAKRTRKGPDPFEISAEVRAAESHARKETVAQTITAWMPYVFLVIFVLLWSYPPVQMLLNKGTFPLPWPVLHNLILRTPPVVPAPSLYPAIFNLNLLSASGSSCMFATFVSVVFLRMPLREFARVVWVTARQLKFAILTIASVLALAFVMNYSGATGTLGLAFAATGKTFPFFSPFLGWLGVFLTGSDTSSNALFGSLQVVTARHLGLSPILIAASNSSGGVMGKMISLQSIAVAAAATGITVQQQSKLLRFTLKHSIFLAALVGLEVLAYAYVFRVV